MYINLTSDHNKYYHFPILKIFDFWEVNRVLNAYITIKVVKMLRVLKKYV